MSDSPEFHALTDDVDWDLVRAAGELLPLLRENAVEAERLRRLPTSTIAALEERGLTRLTTPKQFGGLQANLPTEFEVVRTLATACGSTSWVVALYALCGYWAALFPDAVQEEVFSGPGSRVAGISSPAGTLVPADGGYTLNGRWPWNTGVLDATWNVVATLLPHDDGSMEPYLALVPVTDLRTLDDWHTSAMQGTGSVTSVAQNVFVPARAPCRSRHCWPVSTRRRPIAACPSTPTPWPRSCSRPASAPRSALRRARWSRSWRAHRSGRSRSRTRRRSPPVRSPTCRSVRSS